MRAPPRLVLLAVVAFVSTAATLAVSRLLVPPESPARDVAPAELAADLEAGRIVDVCIVDRVHTFRLVTGERKRFTSAERPSLASVRALRPKDAGAMAPLVRFERRRC